MGGGRLVIEREAANPWQMMGKLLPCAGTRGGYRLYTRDYFFLLLINFFKKNLF